MKIKPANRPPLKKQAEENSTVSKRNGRDTKVIKQGSPIDHTPKHQPNDDLFQTKVGLSKGVTINAGNYQSYRVDVWLTDVLLEGETVEQGLERLSVIVDKQIEVEAQRAREEFDE